MSGGAQLVFWCCIAGLVVVLLSEIWRYRHGTRADTGRSSQARLRAELDRHTPKSDWTL